MTRHQLEALESNVQTAALLVPPDARQGHPDAVRFALVAAVALADLAAEVRRLHGWRR